MWLCKIKNFTKWIQIIVINKRNIWVNKMQKDNKFEKNKDVFGRI